MPDLHLASPAFDDGGEIPDRYGYTEDDVNPPLTVSGVPDEAVALLLIVDDPDAREPAGKVWDHWIVCDIDPDVGDIPADWEPEDAVEGQNDYGEMGWGGPNPPDREHTYRFLLYALDEPTNRSPGVRKDDVYDAAEGSVVGKAELTGTYAP